MWGLKLNNYTLKYFFKGHKLKKQETKKMERFLKCPDGYYYFLVYVAWIFVAEYDCMQVLARHELVTGQTTDNDGNCSAAPCPGHSDCLVIIQRLSSSNQC